MAEDAHLKLPAPLNHIDPLWIFSPVHPSVLSNSCINGCLQSPDRLHLPFIMKASCPGNGLTFPGKSKGDSKHREDFSSFREVRS